MKKILWTLIILITCSMVFAGTQMPPKTRVEPEDFIITFWGNWLAEGKTTDPEAIMADIYDLGFNTGFMNELNKDMILKYKFKPILQYTKSVDKTKSVTENEALVWAKEFYKTVGKDVADSAFQIYIGDEPSGKNIDQIKKYAKAVKEVFNKEAFINFFPNCAGPTALGNQPYSDYLDSFIDTCDIKHLSYDNYSIYNDTLDENRFYSNLEEIRNASIRHNIPFTNIILGCAHFDYSAPTDYSIHVQGWSTLAYGGRGLSYFRIFDPNRGNYGFCAYDKYGNKTLTYNMIREMNYAIHILAPTLINLTSTNVFHYGNIPEGSQGIESSKIIKSIKVVSRDGKPNFLVGEFLGKDNKDYIIIVNKNRENSLRINELIFNNSSKITKITDYSTWPKEAPFNGENIWILPGHGLLLRGD